MKTECDPWCIYFPSSPSSVLNSYVDKNGVKHREGVFCCKFDDHRLMGFELCENYKRMERGSNLK